jgi:hypothetical protein
MRTTRALLGVIWLALSACHAREPYAPEPLGTAPGARAEAPTADGEVSQARAMAPGPAPGGAAYDPSPATPPPENYDAIAKDEREAERPGLGTAFGESRSSGVRSTPFKREHARRPDVVLALRYDDPQGVQQMLDWRGGQWGAAARITSEDGVLVLSLLDEYGRELPAADIDDEIWAAGEPGQRYMIAVQNNGPRRVEAVAAVDGLDVIDGDDAGYGKRGYIVEPWTSLVIEGWRTSLDSVAAFRLAPVEDSYAARTGRGRNVGVVGVAFFPEAGRYDRRGLRRRGGADPFPGR